MITMFIITIMIINRYYYHYHSNHYPYYHHHPYKNRIKIKIDSFNENNNSDNELSSQASCGLSYNYKNISCHKRSPEGGSVADNPLGVPLLCPVPFQPKQSRGGGGGGQGENQGRLENTTCIMLPLRYINMIATPNWNLFIRGIKINFIVGIKISENSINKTTEGKRE